MRRTVLVVGVIAALRLGVFWIALTLTGEYADWRQILGYWLLMLNSIVELSMASAVTHHHLVGSLLTSGLIVLTSALLARAWVIRPFSGP
jgi:hypothetical protein